MTRSMHHVQNRSVTKSARTESEFVQGLERGFAVIKAFSVESPRLTITDVAARTGLTRAVARRYLLTLQALGYVTCRDSSYALTPRLLDIGFTFLSTIGVADIAQPFMETVSASLHESCSVSMLDEAEIVYVGRVSAKRIMSINLSVGSRLPAHATSMGKVLLAHLQPAQLDAYFATASMERRTTRTISDERTLRMVLEQVQRRGWAEADQETEDGIRSVAAPLFNQALEVHAAINVSAHTSRVSLKELRRRHLPVLLDAARKISHALGARVDARDKSRRPTRTAANVAGLDG